ncbi:MAG: ABC transporter ATP-binding protein [Deltaproteobacteria bacterium]|nr:ABC transporter ATP-binding protein [Deltaproteobacteria bacterium]
MLEVRDLEVSYEGVPAVHGASFQVEAGEIVALLGANGAGKTTILRALVGLVRPTRGEVLLFGRPITGHPTEAIVRLGVSLVPEGRRIFPGLTVFGNLEMGATPWSGLGGDISGELEQVLALFPHLRPRLGQRGWSLSGGEQQMLAIGRALMARPRLLLLDEPSLGLGPLVVRSMFQAIREINGRGTTVLLVEQNGAMALGIAHRGYVLEHGRIVLEGDAQGLRANPRVREAYLGA